ncbi:MAG: hypothetical protein Q7K42_00675 [Candidatus Diapherotrites archaeon]|nr:hypothetical protein [Candidatus Diapherotrites archaeon]
MTKILLPLISGQENNEEFLEEATKKAFEVMLLIVVDQEYLPKESGYASSTIMKGTKLMESVKAIIGKKRKSAKEFSVWGKTEEQIYKVAVLQKVDKVVLRKLNNLWFEDVVKELQKSLKKENIELQIIDLPEKVEEIK